MDSQRFSILLLLSCITFVVSLASNSEKDVSSDDIIDQMLLDKQLVPPHEFKSAKARERKSDDKHEGLTNKDENLVQIKMMEVKGLKKDLNECNNKKSQLLEELVKKTMNETSASLETPYLKQVFRVFLAIVKGEHSQNLDVASFGFQVRSPDTKILEECLSDKNSVQTCVDSFNRFLKSGQIVQPPQLLQVVFNFLEKLKLEYFVYFFVGVTFIIAAAYAIKVIMSRNTVIGIVVLLTFLSFVLSVPWEWMRMYKEQLAIKAMEMKTVSDDCLNDKLSYTGMLKWWIQDTFSFSDNDCSRYYKAMLVDPFWEVSPGQAVAASASRIFLQPSLHFAEHLGKFFRLIFKEIPSQWQPFVFIAIVIFFLFSIGIQISTPLLRIGRGDDNKNEVKAQKEHITALKDENGRLRIEMENVKAMLPAIEPRHNEVQAPQRQQAEQREENPPDHDEFVLVQANNAATEEIPGREPVNRREPPKQPIESDYVPGRTSSSEARFF